MHCSEQINEIAAALAVAQAHFSVAEKNGKNPHFKNEFSTIADLHAACKAALGTAGIAVIQPAEFVDNRIVIITRIMHKSGQFIESVFSIKPDSDLPQKLGSAITYGRRYALQAMLNIASSEEDDDGEEASGVENNAPVVNTKESNNKLKELTVIEKTLTEYMDKYVQAYNLDVALEKNKLIKIWHKILAKNPTIETLEDIVKKAFNHYYPAESKNEKESKND